MSMIKYALKLNKVFVRVDTNIRYLQSLSTKPKGNEQGEGGLIIDTSKLFGTHDTFIREWTIHVKRLAGMLNYI